MKGLIIKVKKMQKNKEVISESIEHQILSLGTFFLKNIFRIVEDESNQLKDKNLLLS